MSVGIYIRIRKADGSYPFASAFKTSNGKLRPFYALVHGKPEHHPEGIYYVRHLVNGKRVWEKVGTDPAAAVATAMRRQADKMDGSVTTIEPSPSQAAHTHLQYPSARYRKTTAFPRDLSETVAKLRAEPALFIWLNIFEALTTLTRMTD